MTRPRILITEPEGFSAVALARLDEAFAVDLGPLTRAELLVRVCDYEGLMVRLGHHLDSEVLERASHLRFIASPTTGLNHIDTETAGRFGIAMISLRGERKFLDTIHATAEHTWALLLALLRRIPAAHASVLGGDWDRDRFKAHELCGRTLGIVGFGRLGTKVARYGQAFGMNVVAHDPYVVPPQGVEPLALEELFAKADIIVVLAAYTSQTHGLIGQAHFARCRPGVLLVNTSRGEIIDEQALLAALRNGAVSGAALDVLWQENQPNGVCPSSSALIEYAKGHDNLVITPHVGGATFESMGRTEEFIAEKVWRFING